LTFDGYMSGMAKTFAKDETWFGGFYELAIELGDRNDDRLLRALAAVWAYPSLSGCFLENDVEPEDQERVAVSGKLLNRTHLYGIATLPGDTTSPCGTFVIREDDGPDWLGLYLPMGALETIYPVGGFPLRTPPHESPAWRDELDGCLRDVGTTVYASAPYRLALIGHEVSGELYAADIARNGVPSVRWAAILQPSSTGLRYYPRSA
jgi:hypothetical protein